MGWKNIPETSDHHFHHAGMFSLELPAEKIADELEELIKAKQEKAEQTIHQIQEERERILSRFARTDMSIRRDQAQFSNNDKKHFCDAVLEMTRNGDYQALVLHHLNMDHNMHGSMGPVGMMRFLGWHRRYLLAFEEKLRAADKVLRPTATDALSIPFWRWQDPFPQWLDGFLPQKDPTTGQPPARRRNASPPAKPNLRDQQITMTRYNEQKPSPSANAYIGFSYMLEGWARDPDDQARSLPAHNQVHVWVDGVMSTSSSPTDPIFWLHHAQVDRLWHIWQQSGVNSHPPLTDQDAVMDPWVESYSELLNTEDLGYQYSSEQV